MIKLAETISLAIDALDKAEKQFTFYAEEHRRKGSIEKSATNYGYATICGYAMERLKIQQSLIPDANPYGNSISPAPLIENKPKANIR